MFKKGETVYRIHEWDDKGTVFVQPCIVHACGKKRMVLYSLDQSECVGNQFRPQEEQRGLGVVVRCADRAEAEARALAYATALIPARIAATKHTLNHATEQGYASEAYKQVMIRKIADLRATQPAVIWR